MSYKENEHYLVHYYSGKTNQFKHITGMRSDGPEMSIWQPFEPCPITLQNEKRLRKCSVIYIK